MQAMSWLTVMQSTVHHIHTIHAIACVAVVWWSGVLWSSVLVFGLGVKRVWRWTCSCWGCVELWWARSPGPTTIQVANTPANTPVVERCLVGEDQAAQLTLANATAAHRAESPKHPRLFGPNLRNTLGCLVRKHPRLFGSQPPRLFVPQTHQTVWSETP